MKKSIKWIALGVVAVVVIAVVIVYFNLSGIVRRTVETQASASLNVPTKVGGASVSLFGGSLGLNEIQVSSPQGFSAPQMFALNDLDVDVSYGNLRKDPITIDQIVIDKPKLVIEQSGGKFNFKALMDQQPKQPDDGAEPMKVIIQDLQVKDAAVTLRPGIPGLSEEINIPIPSFELKQIGTGEGANNGAAVKEVVMLLVTTMAGKASESDKLPPEVQLLLKGDVESLARDVAAKYGEKALGELKKNLPPEVGNVVGGVLDATKQGKDPGKAVEEGLKGLLKPGEKSDKSPTTKRN